MNERDNGYLTMALYERSFGAEASGDFVLPDYQNEIRRILHVSQTVLPPAKYVGDESVEFNGTVDYQVVYIGADGGIYSVPLSSDYSFSTAFDKGNNKDVIADISVLCNVTAESVNTRVSAPRRLSIRSRIRPNVRIYAKIPSSAQIEADVSPMDVYRKYENASWRHVPAVRVIFPTLLPFPAPCPPRLRTPAWYLPTLRLTLPI